MMTDRELLELAARAAGIEYGADRTDCGISITGKDGRHIHFPKWNPLIDPGDALRLLQFLGEKYGVQVIIGSGINVDLLGIHHCDTYEEATNLTSTMRAIVRAAAEVGKGISQAFHGDVVDEDA